MLKRMENEREGMKRGAISWCTGKEPRKSDGLVIALAFFSGSGNTWLRYLLQQVTGRYLDICTMLHDIHAWNTILGKQYYNQLVGWNLQCIYVHT